MRSRKNNWLPVILHTRAHKNKQTHIYMIYFQPPSNWIRAVFCQTFLCWDLPSLKLIFFTHFLRVKCANSMLYMSVLVSVCLCVDKCRLHWLPCGPLDGHKHKDMLINSLNVCEGEHPPRVAMHPCVHDREESRCLWRARGRAVPGTLGRELVQTVLWPIVMQDNPKSGNQRQHQVVPSTLGRGGRWTKKRDRACWARPGRLRLTEQDQLTKEDMMCGDWLQHGFVLPTWWGVCVCFFLCERVRHLLGALPRKNVCGCVCVYVQGVIPVNKDCSDEHWLNPALSECEGRSNLRRALRLCHISATSGNVRGYS